MTNLDFADRYDLERFKKICADMRAIAKRYPAYDGRMCDVEEYGRTIGPWSVRFTLEVFATPIWHGSAAIIEQIGYQTETGTLGMKYEVPQDALLSVSSWHPEHHEQARYILAEIFGDILRPADDHQPAKEHIGLWCMHWQVPYEGDKFWLKHLH